MQFTYPAIVAQFDFFGGILGVVASIIISFVAIALVASYYRFQHIIQHAEDAQPEELGAAADDILRVQLAVLLAGCSRRGTSFSLSLLRLTDPGFKLRMDSPLITSLKSAVRRSDTICIFDAQTIALMSEVEPEDVIQLLERVVAKLSADGAGELCAGVSSYPGHGLSGKDLIAAAEEGLEQTDAENPIVMPEIVDIDEEDEGEGEKGDAVEEQEVFEEDEVDDENDEDSSSRGWNERRKSSMLDEVTGVLKPSAVSAYMQRMLSEMRHKKKDVSLFCIGLNNMDHIARFHGEDAVNDVLAGVSKILQDSLRADDLIGRHEKYAFLVLAQCSLDEAEIIGKRVTTLVQHAQIESGAKKLRTTITLGVAAYPTHGRNLHHLYTAGQKVLDYSRANDIRAYAVYDAEIHDKVPAKPMKSIKSMQV